MPFTYPYPRPSVTCDVVVFTMRADGLAVLLIKRKNPPFKGVWALPGGYVNENESLERAASRELAEETGISGVRLEQLGAFGDPGRDPRGHTISVAYMTFLVAEAKITAGDDAAAVAWHAFRSLSLGGDASSNSSLTAAGRRRGPPKQSRRTLSNGHVGLAFDHAKIVARAYRRLYQMLDHPLHDSALRARGFDFLPSRFTLADLQRFYEVVLGRSLSTRSFRKRLLDFELVIPAGSKPTPRPSDQLYRWNRR